MKHVLRYSELVWFLLHTYYILKNGISEGVKPFESLDIY